jgi:L-ornithine N5-oxygenase
VEYLTKKVIGIGLGPANLALAVALLEEGADKLKTEEIVFLEKNNEVTWHPGMLLNWTRLQVPFLKDLVTIRNPTSYFSFLNFLKVNGRINEFINAGAYSPTRLEFTQYLSWVKSNLPDEIISYGKNITNIVPIYDNSMVTDLLVQYEDTKTQEIQHMKTSKIVVSVGGEPNIPKLFKPHIGKNIIHSNDFTTHLPKWLNKEKPLRFGIIGSGQSAAEIIYHLHEELADCQIYSIMRRNAFRPEDNSQFINEVFFPENVDFMYNLPQQKREFVIQNYWNTNYAAVNINLIDALYNKIYQDKVQNKGKRINIFNYSSPLQIKVDNELNLTIKNIVTDETTTLDLDVIILATGYDRTGLPNFMEELRPYFLYEDNKLQIDRSYRISTTNTFKPHIYVQGMSEHIHGISNSLLSILPIRSAEIARSICESGEILNLELDKKHINV